MVLDLLQHGQEEARELYADRWLGFTPAALETVSYTHLDVYQRQV